MAGFNEGIKVFFGGDTTQLQAAISQAHAMTGKFAKDSAKVFEEVGKAEQTLAAVRKDADLQRGAAFKKDIILQREIIGLKKSIDSIQGQTTEKIALQVQLEQKLLQLEMSVAAAAQKTAQARAAAGGATYSSTMSDAAKNAQAAAANTGLFGASLGRLNIVGKAVTGTLKSLTGIGAALFAPQIADLLARLITGFSKKAEKDLEDLVEKTGKAADKAEARLQKAKDESEKKDAERVQRLIDQQKLVWEARMEYFENVKKAEEEAADKAKKVAKEAFDEDLKWVKERDKLNKTLKEQKLEALKPEERVLALTKEVNELKAKQAKYSKEDNEYKEIAVSLNEKNKQIEKDRADIAKVRADEEKRVLEYTLGQIESKKQEMTNVYRAITEDLLMAGGRVFGPSADKEQIAGASDSELRELIRKRKQDIQFVEGTKGTGPSALADAATNFLNQGSIISRLQTDINRANYQLDLRNKLNADFRFGGEATARSRFQGDPLAFDRLFDQFVKTQSVAEKTLTVQEDILEALTRRGILTFPSKNPPTGP